MQQQQQKLIPYRRTIKNNEIKYIIPEEVYKFKVDDLKSKINSIFIPDYYLLSAKEIVHTNPTPMNLVMKNILEQIVEFQRLTENEKHTK
jgi:hypothetical protein